MTFNELIGKRISDLLKAKNLKQVDLVDNNILKASHISHIIKGNAGISLPALVFVCEKLEISLSDFFQPLQKGNNLPANVTALLADCRELTSEDAETVHVLAKHLLYKNKAKIQTLSSVNSISTIDSEEDDESEEDEEPKYYLPLLGQVAAGSPIYRPADDDERVEIPEKYSNPDLYAVFQARGDSMEPKIPNGSFIVAEVDARPIEGGVAVVMLSSFSDAEYVVKRVYLKRNGMILRSFNPKYTDMTVSADEVRRIYKMVCLLPR